MRIISFLLIIGGLLPVPAAAQSDSSSQDVLTLQEAIDQALAHNYNIRITRYEEKIAQNNVSYGHAGMLPQVTAEGSGSLTYNNTEQEFITGETINRNNAKSSRWGAGVYLDWTIFDGGRMFTTYDKLEVMREMGMLETRAQIEQVINNVINTYYQVVQQQQQVQVARQAVELSEQRLELISTRYEVGKASRMEKLQAKVDMQRDRSRMLEQRKNLENQKIELNRLIGREVQTSYSIRDSIATQDTLAFQALKDSMYQLNPELLQARKAEEAAHMEMQEIQSERYPEVALQSNYTFNRSASEAGFLVSQQNTGPQYGFTIGIPLFNGYNLNRRIENARLMMEQQQVQAESQMRDLEAELASQYQEYKHYQKLIGYEEEAVRVARQNLEIARENYRLGRISALELREVQQNYNDARTRLVDARYRLKRAEIQLLYLSGGLLKD